MFFKTQSNFQQNPTYQRQQSRTTSVLPNGVQNQPAAPISDGGAGQESFLHRQKRLNPQQTSRAQPQPNQAGSNNSPVSSDGSVSRGMLAPGYIESNSNNPNPNLPITASGNGRQISGDNANDMGFGNDRFGWDINNPNQPNFGSEQYTPGNNNASPTTDRYRATRRGAGDSFAPQDALNAIREEAARYGFQWNDQFTEEAKRLIGYTSGTGGNRPTATRLDNGRMGNPQEALNYIQGEAQKLLNRQLSDEEIKQAIQISGWGGQGQISGEQVNIVLAELESRAPSTGGGNGNITGAQFNQILDEIEKRLGYGSGNNGGTGGGGNGGGGNQGGSGGPISGIPQLPKYNPSIFNVNLPDAYKFESGSLGTDRLPTYNPSSFSQFQSPDSALADAQQYGLLTNILNDPHSLNDQTVNQIKNRQKEDSLAMERQLLDRLGADAARRGITGGGYQGAQTRRVGEATTSDILRGFRDVDIAKAQQDRQDEAQALQLADAVLGGRLNRSISGFGATLSGQQAQAQENQVGWQSQADASRFDLQRRLAEEQQKQAAYDAALRNAGFDFTVQQAQADENARGHGFDVDSTRFNVDNLFRNYDTGFRDRQLNLQQELGRGGLDIDRSRLTETGRQFNLGHILNLQQFLESTRQFDASLGENARQFDNSLGENSRQFDTSFGEGQRQFNNNLGFNYNQLNQQGQNSLFNWLLGLSRI